MQPQQTRTTSKNAIALLLKGAGTRFAPLGFSVLALVLIISSKAMPGAVGDVRMFVTDLFAPALETVAAPIHVASDKLSEVTDIRSLRAENIRLKEENDRLKAWYETALKLQAENASLRAFLNYPKDPELGYITTRVIAFGGGSFVKSFLIPVGSKDGVRVGQAVLAGEGMVGRIVETGRNSARVLMLSDLNSHIPVLVQNTRQKAIAAGINDDGKLVLQRLAIDASNTFERGARVVTSGDGGLFMPDIPIGEITGVEDGRVVVRPLVDLRKLSYVQVLETPQDRLPDLLPMTGTNAPPSGLLSPAP